MKPAFFFLNHTLLRYLMRPMLWVIFAFGLPVATYAHSNKSKTLTKITKKVVVVDSDGDGVDDATDLDDDNDGILDTIENAPCQAIDYNVLANKQKIIISTTASTGGTGTVQNLLNGNLTEQVFWYTSSSIAAKELVRLQFPKPTVLTGIEYYIGNSYMLNNGVQTKIQGSNDGTNWVDVSPVFTKVRPPNNSPGAISGGPYAENFLWTNTTAYLYYRHLGISGNANLNPYVYEMYFQTGVVTPCDFDGDGIINSLDLDSDNDGIPDNVEAQLTLTYISPNADSPATYASNNGVNSAYLGGLTPIDTDGDGYQDICDLDSDNDLDLDKTESGLTFNGVPGLNGLDSGSETADDYSDVNGIINSPKNDLASSNPGVSEVKYREIPPLKRTITVCYKSGLAYGIGGGQRTNAADKLTNPANFSLTGTSTFTFKLVPFAVAFTKSGLEAQGCQIVDLGIDNNDAGGTTNIYSASEKTELNNWNAASKSNVILAFQNYAGVLVPGYTGVAGNTNPNSFTALGDAIITGPFGAVAGFNQGGGYQGSYSAVPASACVIVQDNLSPTKRTTGVIDKSTNDIYLADVDLITELGGLTTNATITSNTDKLFANLYHSLAKLVVFTPNDPCTYFSCTAGQNAPTLSASNISGTGSVNLSSITASNLPSGTTLTWHTSTPATNANKIPNPGTYSTSGTIFASFYDSVSDCYAGGGATTTPVMVTIIAGPPSANLSVSIASPTQTGNKGENLTYTLTLTNAGPATATNVVVSVPMPEPKASLISSTAVAGTYNAVTKEWTVPSLAVGSTTLTFTVKVN